MGIFGSSEKEDDAKILGLKEDLRRSQIERKKLASELTQERAKAATWFAQIEQGKAELEKMKGALTKMRQRQKGSVERANRFKARLNKES